MSIGSLPEVRYSRHLLATALPLAMLLAGKRALAAPASTSPPSEVRAVEVSSPTCKEDSSFPMVPFLDALRVELSGRSLLCCTLDERRSESPTGPSLRVSIEIDPCVADGSRVQASVNDPANGRTAEREVSLADVDPPVRARALALAVAELIRTLGQVPSPEPPPPESPARVEAPQAPISSPQTAVSSGLSIGLEGELRALPVRDTTMWGGRLRLTLPWRAFHADVDLGTAMASGHDDLGEVSLRSASVGLCVGPRLANRIATLDLGLRAELGWAWILGEATRAGVHAQEGAEPTASAGLRASLDVPARSWVHARAAFEAGFVLAGVKGESNHQPVVGMTGYYLLAALGIAVSP